jgi:hypothetical protein
MNPIAKFENLSVHMHDPEQEVSAKVCATSNVMCSKGEGEQNGAIPSRIFLPDGCIAKIGNFKLAAKQDKALLAMLLKPEGSINKGAGIHSQPCYSFHSVRYHYEAHVNSPKTTEAAHQFNVLIEVYKDSLTQLTAQSATYPGLKGEIFTFKVEFSFRSEPISHLLKLPTELLLCVAAHAGINEKEVGLKLRLVNGRLKEIADKGLSRSQKFLITHGEALEASGYEGWEMCALAGYSAHEQEFLVGDIREKLYRAGYQGYEMNELAKQPADQQKFVLDKLNLLEQAGYKGYEMNELAQQPADQRTFVLDNYLVLKGKGYNGWAMNNLATQPPVERNAILQCLKKGDRKN